MTFWSVFLAVLLANFVTIIAVYLFVAYHHGQPLIQTGVNVLSGVTLLGWRALQLYLALIVLGAIAYGIKLLVLG
jgi:hypothetical protein